MSQIQDDLVDTAHPQIATWLTSDRHVATDLRWYSDSATASSGLALLI